jgi:hypothetical protein
VNIGDPDARSAMALHHAEQAYRPLIGSMPDTEIALR